MSKSCDKICGVCGGPASGKHYNAFTCEGCKGFFRRSVIKNCNHYCKFGHLSCSIGVINRRKSCRRCRFDKCIEIGMRPELVDRKERDGINPDVQDDSFVHLLNCITFNYHSTIGHLKNELFTSRLDDRWKFKSSQTLDLTHEEIIAWRCQYFDFSTDLRTSLICLMCQINLFVNIPKDAKEFTIKEIKDCLAMILIASTYDSSEDTITWPGGQRLTRQFLLSSRFGPVVDQLFQLIWYWNELNLDDDRMPFFTGFLLSSHWSVLAISNRPYEFFSYLLHLNQFNFSESQVSNLINRASELAPLFINLLWI